MTPSVGRIVHLYKGNSRHPVAGVITRVHGPELVNLTTFPDCESPRVETSIRLFADEAQAIDALDTNVQSVAAFWPPRV